MKLNLKTIAPFVVLVCLGITSTSSAQIDVAEWYPEAMNQLAKEIKEYGYTQTEKPYTEDGETVLHRAALLGRVEDINWLIDTCHCFVDVENKNGMTPLHIAAYNNHTEAIIALLEHGANIEKKDATGRTPLLFSLTLALKNNDHNKALGTLLLRGANCNVTDPKTLATPLLFAAFFNKIEIAQLLLDYHANPNIGDKAGSTPLFHAIYRQNVSLAELLLSKGTYPSTIDYTVADKMETCDEKEAILELLSQVPQEASAPRPTPLGHS